jgi:hypothetical protein
MNGIPSMWMHDDYKDFLVALEDAYGVSTDLTFVPMRGWGFQEKWLEADEKELEYAVPYGGARAFSLLKKRASISFKMAAVGYGAAVTGIPPWDAVISACRARRIATVAPTAAATIAATAVAGAGADGVWTYSRTDAYAGLLDRVVTITCTTAGGSGVAEFTVAAPAVEYLPAYEETGVVMTTAAEFPLPGGASVTPTAITTPFGLGDSYTINLTAPGATYQPVSNPALHRSCNIRCYLDDPSLAEGHKRLYQLQGCRGSIKLNQTSGDYPYFDVQLTSLFTLPADAEAVAVDYVNWPDPIEVSTENTPIRRIFGRIPIFDNVEVDFGVTAEFVSRVGREGVQANSHKAAITMKAEEPGLAEWNILADVTAKPPVTGDLVIQHGTVSGHALRISADTVQLAAPGNSVSGVTRMVDLSGKLRPSSGNDDWTLKAL